MGKQEIMIGFDLQEQWWIVVANFIEFYRGIPFSKENP